MKISSVDILYLYYTDKEGNISIGGVQSYIRELSSLIVEMGMNVRIIQFSDSPFTLRLSEKIRVESFAISCKNPNKRYRKLYEEALRTRTEPSFTIFAADTIVPHKINEPCLTIQHGIFWDIPLKTTRPLFHQSISRAIASYRQIRRLRQVSQVVCVDYNFVNWYRTQLDRVENHFHVIPNYARIAPNSPKQQEEICLIFARRLFDYRGTRVFTKAIKPLLERYPNLKITIAGSGPDESWMKEQLSFCDRVQFIRYTADCSIDIHRSHHIAAVPSVGSEGTSLSLLEAMAAGCAVVCTDVGGMTQIIIDGYNGFIVPAAQTEPLRDALEKLISDSVLRQKLANRAYETASAAFSYERWQAEWKKLLQEILF